MHLLESMAYIGQKPWHGLGNQLTRQQPIETWKQQAGMDWKIEESEVRYIAGSQNMGAISAFPGRRRGNKALYRSDTKAPLAVVSKRFQVVQPGEILEFYRDLTANNGFELETAESCVRAQILGVGANRVECFASGQGQSKWLSSAGHCR
ncbi:DUF932 domain-containing protein [Xanthomonas sp. NCPPB 1325]|uniref:DUF932 domain-containing protein n=1 Tax=Xanthomonas sp. NCPPB 1325 TaxID=487529 RepID=UPI003557A416